MVAAEPARGNSSNKKIYNRNFQFWGAITAHSTPFQIYNLNMKTYNRKA